MEIREDLGEDVKPYVRAWYPEEDPTPQVNFGTDREMYSSKDESDKDWSSNKEEVDQLAWFTISDEVCEIYHQKWKAFLALAGKRDRGGTDEEISSNEDEELPSDEETDAEADAI